MRVGHGMDDVPQDIPAFGEELPGMPYAARPGAYAVILDEGRMAVIHTPQGYFLPGGGRANDEPLLATLEREVLEECGRAIEIERTIGEAVEYLFAESEGRYYRVEATFFTAKLGEQKAEPVAQDHRLVWLEASSAAGLLQRKSQAWAVQRALDPAGAGHCAR